MSDQYLGEIRMVGFDFAPYGWAQCQGQLISITQNSALFALFGTNYGGNGQQTFGVPDLVGRTPVAFGTSGSGAPSYVIGQKGGNAQVTQTTLNMPAHNHPLVNTLAVQVDPTVVLNVEANLQIPTPGAYLALPTDSSGGAINLYHAPDSSQTTIPLAPNAARLNGSVVEGVVGGSQPISVLNPYSAVNFIVAMQGVYPTRQ
ncbi:tail fiber protein [Pseudomonas sp. 3A(2025)]